MIKIGEEEEVIVTIELAHPYRNDQPIDADGWTEWSWKKKNVWRQPQENELGQEDDEKSSILNASYNPL